MSLNAARHNNPNPDSDRQRKLAQQAHREKRFLEAGPGPAWELCSRVRILFESAPPTLALVLGPMTWILPEDDSLNFGTAVMAMTNAYKRAGVPVPETTVKTGNVSRRS